MKLRAARGHLPNKQMGTAEPRIMSVEGRIRYSYTHYTSSSVLSLCVSGLSWRARTTDRHTGSGTGPRGPPTADPCVCEGLRLMVETGRRAVRAAREATGERGEIDRYREPWARACQHLQKTLSIDREPYMNIYNETRRSRHRHPRDPVTRPFRTNHEPQPRTGVKARRRRRARTQQTRR